MARVRALILAASLVAVAVFGALVSFDGGRAGAAGAHRALVIVDTGATTYQRVVTFDADSITGMQALDLAGANPVVYSFSGQGGAVCRLFGVGRDAGPNCLGGADGDNRYWAYFRSPSGTSSFTYSRTGGGATQVHDGDVEGWKFGTGQGPAWSPLPAPTTTTTVAPPLPATSPPGEGGAGSSGGPNGAVDGGPNGAVAGPPAGATPEQVAAYWTALAAAGTTTSTTNPLAATEVRGASTARARSGRSSGRVAAGPDALERAGNSGTTPWGSMIGFAAAAAAIVGIGLYLRRTRSRPIP